MNEIPNFVGSLLKLKCLTFGVDHLPSIKTEQIHLLTHTMSTQDRFLNSIICNGCSKVSGILRKLHCDHTLCQKCIEEKLGNGTSNIVCAVCQTTNMLKDETSMVCKTLMYFHNF